MSVFFSGRTALYSRNFSSYQRLTRGTINENPKYAYLLTGLPVRADRPAWVQAKGRRRTHRRSRCTNGTKSIHLLLLVRLLGLVGRSRPHRYSLHCGLLKFLRYSGPSGQLGRRLKVLPAVRSRCAKFSHSVNYL